MRLDWTEILIGVLCLAAIGVLTVLAFAPALGLFLEQ
jgi:gas vesicle protein